MERGVSKGILTFRFRYAAQSALSEPGSKLSGGFPINGHV